MNNSLLSIIQDSGIVLGDGLKENGSTYVDGVDVHSLCFEDIYI
jgi:hypothetical protein